MVLTVGEARALDNGMFLVTSTEIEPWTHWMRSGCLGSRGQPDCGCEELGTLAIAEVNLSERFDSKWLGDFGNHIPRERPLWDEAGPAKQ
jgi:hypothetical protein